MKVPSHDVSVLYNESESEFSSQITCSYSTCDKIVVILIALTADYHKKLETPILEASNLYKNHSYSRQCFYVEGIIKQANYFIFLVRPIKSFSQKTKILMIETFDDKTIACQN